tara:strand:- start:18896 stop:19336 length:441 start_codon:yes stop_codon:yes gene_type:complete
MGNLQELLERTTIDFPKPVNKKEARKIFEHISKKLGEDCRIWGESLSYFRVSRGQTQEKFIKEIKGAIIKNSITASFFLTDEENSSGMFSGIRFNTVPGYSLEQHDQKEILLYDEVREHIENYFENEVRQQEFPYSKSDLHSAKLL